MTSSPVAWMALRWETSEYIRNTRNGQYRGDYTTLGQLVKLTKVKKAWDTVFPGEYLTSSTRWSLCVNAYDRQLRFSCTDRAPQAAG